MEAKPGGMLVIESQEAGSQGHYAGDCCIVRLKDGKLLHKKVLPDKAH